MATASAGQPTERPPQVVLQRFDVSEMNHFLGTVATPVDLERLRDVVDAGMLANLLAGTGSAGIRIWGVASRGASRAAFEQVKVGATVLFGSERTVFASARITAMWISHDVAERLWGFDAEGNVRELLYSVDDYRGDVERDLPADVLHRLIGSSGDESLPDFLVLDEEQSAGVLEHLDDSTLVRSLATNLASDQAKQAPAPWMARYAGDTAGMPLTRRAREWVGVALSMLGVDRETELDAIAILSAGLVWGLRGPASSKVAPPVLDQLHASSSSDLPPAEYLDQALNVVGLRADDASFEPLTDDDRLKNVLTQRGSEQLMRVATTFARRTTDDAKVHSRHLLASAATAQQLRQRTDFVEKLGVDWRRLVSTVTDCISAAYPDEAQAWAAIRTEALGPEPQLLGHVDSDLVAWEPGRRLVDHLDVGTYVTMLATIVAARDTPMPMSIGLFGEWGSGKSYFMGLMRQTIDELGTAPVGETASPFCRNVVQIQFNAWHYADANLWASLAVRVFDQLADVPGRDIEQRAAERESLLQQLETYKEAKAALEQDKQRAADRLRLANERLAAASGSTTTAENLLDAVAVEDVSAVAANDPAVRQLIAQARQEAAALGIASRDGVEGLYGLAAELTGLTVDASRVWDRLKEQRRYSVLVACAAILAVAGLVLLGTQGILRGMGGASLVGAVAAVTVVARAASHAVATVRATLRQVELAIGVADATRARHERRRAERLAALRQQVDAARARQAELQARASEAAADVTRTQKEINDLAAGPRLYRFIAERSGSDDYRKQLGVVSLLRQDFEELTRRLRARLNDRAEDADSLERIVLYIDDLDRCPPARVVQVLEAVHLLLAMDLFVVVVGVDPRWLLRALRQQYAGILSDDAADRAGQTTYWQSTPQNYLEKIFQIPFVLPGMSPTAFTALLAGAVRPTAGTDQSTTPAGPTQDVVVTDPSSVDSPGASAAAAAPVEATKVTAEEGSVVDRATDGVVAEQLDLTSYELKFLGLLASVVRTPRAAKRMINIYRMLRATRDLGPASQFLGRDGAGEYQAVAQLVGVLTATPHLLGPICGWAGAGSLAANALLSRGPDESWTAFVDALDPHENDLGRWTNAVSVDISAGDLDDWRSVVRALQAMRARITLPDRLEPYQLWAPRISRFAFELSPFTTGMARPATIDLRTDTTVPVA